MSEAKPTMADWFNSPLNDGEEIPKWASGGGSPRSLMIEAARKEGAILHSEEFEAGFKQGLEEGKLTNWRAIAQSKEWRASLLRKLEKLKKELEHGCGLRYDVQAEGVQKAIDIVASHFAMEAVK